MNIYGNIQVKYIHIVNKYSTLILMIILHYYTKICIITPYVYQFKLQRTGATVADVSLELESAKIDE